MKNLRNSLIALLFLTQTVFASADTRTISSEPKEIYGGSKKNIQIRIGNGGAGSTGILRALAEDYLKSTSKNYSIAWYQDISINTLFQLKSGVIDIALVYEKSQGDTAQKEGWATNYTPIFNDHFLIVGPKKNPAQLTESDSPQQAFAKIATLGKKNSNKIFSRATTILALTSKKDQSGN